jgi:hypothetical protein
MIPETLVSDAHTGYRCSDRNDHVVGQYTRARFLPISSMAARTMIHSICTTSRTSGAQARVSSLSTFALGRPSRTTLPGRALLLWAGCTFILVGCEEDTAQAEEPADTQIVLYQETQSAIGYVALSFPVDSAAPSNEEGSSTPIADGQVVVLTVTAADCVAAGHCSEDAGSTCTITAVHPDRVEIQAEFRTNRLSTGRNPCSGQCGRASVACGEIVLSGETITIDEPDSDLFVIPASQSLPFDSWSNREVRVPRD